MKALVYTSPGSLELQDVAQPVPNAGEQLVRVHAVGICGSDIHAYHGYDERRPPPLVLGHEVAGVTEPAGARVTVNPLVTCGACPACRAGKTNLCPDRQILSMPPREGGFAELVAVPEENLVEVPSGFSLVKAALAEPLSVCWHSVRLCDEHPALDLKTARVLVIGGGAIGFGALLCLEAFGAEDITLVETNSGRAEHLKTLTDATISAPDDLGDVSFDLVIDAVGYTQTRALACEVTRPGGVICHIGLGNADGGIDIRRLTLQEITFFGTYAYTKQDFIETCAAMFDGRLGTLDWFDESPLEDGAAAFARLDAGQSFAPKIILKP